MTRVKLALTCALILGGCLVGACLPASAQAADTCSLRQAVKREHVAHRAFVRARTEYRTARYVTRATRAATEAYGKRIGRWVWLANDVGWPRSEWRTLIFVINRESGGNPNAKNPTSTASGLLQMLAFHWDGSGDYGWKFDPFDPRQNLEHGYKLYLKQGWAPWTP